MQTSAITKGILLAGGTGTRLRPLTRVVNKQLLPVYDRPLVYYALATLMEAGVRQVLLVSTPADVAAFERLFGDGSQLGLQLEYLIQPRAGGLAEALLLARDFIGGERVALVLGDNLLLGEALPELLARAATLERGAVVFAQQVADPHRYGIVEFDADGRPLEIDEKPARCRSNWALAGLYFYDARAVDVAAAVRPSPRGELEISDVNRWYLEQGDLHVERLGAETHWRDVATPDDLLEASGLIARLEHETGRKWGCPEEVAFRQGRIGRQQLRELGNLQGGDYGRWLTALANAAR